MTRRTITFWLPAIVLAFSPAVAYADAGTPLLWATAFHLLLGNTIIGVAEGLILALLFRLRRAPCIAVMIAANYFSAWAGGVFLLSTFSPPPDLDLYSAWRWLWSLVPVSYAVTLLLEWPFVAFCLRKSDGWWRKSIWGSLVVQSASYLAVFGWYWAASQTSLYTDLAVVQPSEMSLPNDATLYYLADSDGDVDARELGQGETRKICQLEPAEKSDRLLLRESRTSPGRWDLIVGSKSEERSPAERTVSGDLACAAAQPPCVGLYPGGDVPRFPKDASGWQFRFGWMEGGLYGKNANNGRRLNAALETPFLRWPVSYPTQLPNGQVVFQLGWNQICVLDPNERTIGLLAKGRWPVVTMKHSPE